MFLYPVITLHNFLEHTISHLGDPAYQDRVWIKHEGKEVDDYDEATMRFMERCEDMFAHPNSYEGMDSVIQVSLRKLYDKICDFDDTIANQFPEGKEYEMINTLEWREIQSLASHSHKIIRNNLKERNYDCE